MNVHDGMTKRVLTDILAREYGTEAPSNATKVAILGLLKEAGCPVNPSPESNDESNESNSDDKKQAIYVINIFKQKGEKGAVTGCINGQAFALPRGKDIEVSKAIYENLTKGAIKRIGEPLEDGGMEMFDQASYPLSLVEIK